MSDQNAQLLIVLYDYKSNDVHELSLKKNEKLELLDGSGPWWKVRNSQNKEGFVPSNYCKAQKQNIFHSLRNTLGRKKSKHTSTDGVNRLDQDVSKSSLNNLNKDPNSNMNSLPMNNRPDPIPKSGSKFEQTNPTNDDSIKISGLNISSLNNHNINNNVINNGSVNGKTGSNFPHVNQFDSISRTPKIPHEEKKHQINRSKSELNATWCVARFDYTAQQKDEMTVLRGQRIQVLEKSSDGWWHGRALCDNGEFGEIGWFPSNYVIVDQTNNIPGTNKFNPSSNSLGRSTNGNPAVMNHGPVDNNGKIFQANSALNVSDVASNLTRLDLSHGYNPSRPQYQNGKQIPSTLNNNNNNEGSVYLKMSLNNNNNNGEERVYHKVLTLYPFNKIQEEELSFIANEVLVVIDKPVDDPEWWKCRNNRGDVGLVPINYIKVLPEAPSSPKNIPSHISAHHQHQQDSPNHQSRLLKNEDQYHLNGNQKLMTTQPQLHRFNTQTDAYNTSSYNIHNNNNNHYNSGRSVDGETLRLQYASSSTKPDLKNEPWYWGNISRADCESMLGKFGKIGDYVIRDSETHPGDLTITMMAGLKNRNFKVRVSDNIYHIGQKRFDSLNSLIDHYTKYPIYKFETDKQFLRRPFRHPGYATNTMLS